jgi:hypothetical protein
VIYFTQVFPWLSFAAVIVLFLAASLILLTASIRRGVRYQWLIALLGVAFALVFVVLSSQGLPHEMAFIDWQSSGLWGISPIFLLDQFSWAFALAFTTLMVSVILTAVGRLSSGSWNAWVGSLFMTAVGITAVLSGNPLTLLLAWGALDITEVLIWLPQVPQHSTRQRIFVSFFSRSIGSAVLVVVLLLVSARGQGFSFSQMPADMNPLLILAAILRLGVLPLHGLFLDDASMRRGIGTILRFFHAVSSLVVVARTSVEGVPDSWLPWLLGIAFVTSMLNGFFWITARDELNGRPFWIMATASLAVIAAVMRQPEACLAWGTASIFMGGILFLHNLRHPNLIPFLAFAALCLSALPLTPTWQAAAVYQAFWDSYPSGTALILSVLLVICHLLVFGGYLRFAFSVQQVTAFSERWIWLVYPLGLALLLLFFLAFGWMIRPDFDRLSPPYLIVGLVIISAAALAGLVTWRRPSFILPLATYLIKSELIAQIFSFKWLYQGLRRLFALGRGGAAVITFILEGEAGLLWAFFLLIMLFSLTLQLGLTR